MMSFYQVIAPTSFSRPLDPWFMPPKVCPCFSLPISPSCFHHRALSPHLSVCLSPSRFLSLSLSWGGSWPCSGLALTHHARHVWCPLRSACVHREYAGIIVCVWVCVIHRVQWTWGQEHWCLWGGCHWSVHPGTSLLWGPCWGRWGPEISLRVPR